MLVITGTQRSGTSLIAKALIDSGYDLGTDWFDEEVQGGYEHPTLCSFYSNYLGDPTFPFVGCPTSEGSLGTTFKALNHQVVKFSYLLMNPAFVTIWSKFRPADQDTFLIMHRRPDHVVASKMRVAEKFVLDSLLLQQTPQELLGNFVSSREVLKELGYGRASLNFPECLDDIDLINRKLAYLDSTVQIKPKVWKQVLDKKKIHF